MTSALQVLGFGAWFEQRLDTEFLEQHALARVLTVQKNSYLVSRGLRAAFAEPSGKLLYSADSPLGLPTVGDWVYADFFDDDSHAIIHGLLPRKTLLKRKSAGNSSQAQLIAANIDCAFILQGVDRDFNPRRLERYLVMVNDGGIEPVILLSKSDLQPAAQLQRIVASTIEVAAGARVIPFSNQDGSHIETIRKLLVAGQTCCLLGSSGVGKTSLLNHLAGADAFKTAQVSVRQGKGRHTTTRRELVRLDGGALLIDTPGMRELGNTLVDSGVDDSFAEIGELARNCRFGDCRHQQETGCAVRAAIENGVLDPRRFDNYLKLQREVAFNEMSYHQKKQKQREFGKLVKSTLKNKPR